MNYDDFANMTELGRQVGMTSHEFGRLLVKAGIRTEANEPSEFAIRNGFVKFVPNGRNDAPYPIWHKVLTIKALRKLGLLPSVDQAEPGSQSLDR